MMVPAGGRPPAARSSVSSSRMWVFPLAAGLVAVALAASLGRRYLRARNPYLGVWSVALAMYAAASLAVAAGAAFGWSRGLFEVYWTLGAVLNVPLLAAGEVELLWPGAFRAGSIGRAALWIVLAFVVAFTVAVTRGAAMDAAALGERLPSGKDVFGDGTVAHRLPQVISIPSYLILVVGALWSAWRMRGRPELRDRAAGTLLIAAGATITAAAGSAFAALGNLPAFSVSLLAGVAVMFAGFRRATRATRPPPTRVVPGRREPSPPSPT
jgi:drug/metabolite transporter (DMT)-like permease